MPSKREMKKVLLTEKFVDPIDKRALIRLEEFADVKTASGTTEAQLAAELVDVDVVIVRLAPITRSILNSAPNLRGVCRTGVGVDMVDIDAATEMGIFVCNVPGQHKYAVAEHALAMIFALAKNLVKSDKLLRTNGWASRSTIWPSNLELHGKSVGIIGLGESGFELAIRARACGMDILGYDPFIPEKKASDINAKLVDIETLLTDSDFVSIHCPLTEETRNLINDKRIKLMKDSAFLVNCGRGPIVNQEALVAALTTGVIAGAGLDVFETEPLDPKNPLLIMENVILTPHVAGMTYEVRTRVMDTVVENTIKVLRGETPDHLINTSVTPRKS